LLYLHIRQLLTKSFWKHKIYVATIEPHNKKRDDFKMATATYKKDSTVRARIDPELKKEAEQVLFKLGLTTSDAIRLFLEQVRLRQGIPFPIAIPRKETLDALKETRSGKDLETYDNADELFEKMDW